MTFESSLRSTNSITLNLNPTVRYREPEFALKVWYGESIAHFDWSRNVTELGGFVQVCCLFTLGVTHFCFCI